jgi:class 3 adenylate cyclase
VRRRHRECRRSPRVAYEGPEPAILIDENTRRGLGDGIAVEAQGDLLMKGKTQPVKVYAVLVESLVTESP